uniref:Fibronectin type-III domain-containing protein n=1 Tax=Strigamia maritima TaxID=126957 RepID=T1IJM2_STRMM
MVEYGKYSNELYELQASRWEWKRLKPKPPKNGPPPCPRLGHSFTLIGNKAYLFGGLANDSEDPKNNIPRYLNDLYTLELKLNSSAMNWDIPTFYGQPPPPRESHTGVAYHDKDGRKPRLIIYGGMSGCRLGDLWQLDIDSLTWNKPIVNGIPPLPRSLHSATLIGHRMFIFGGWVPLVMDDVKVATHEKEWKCTNTLASLNLESMTWEPLAMEVFEDAIPRARAGHCSVAITTRLYIWSGRDGYRKAWNNQVCCKDLWFLETEKPASPTRVQLVRASTTTLEVCWGAVPTADAYLLQLQKYDMPPATAVATVPGIATPASAAVTPASPSVAPITAPSIISPKPTIPQQTIIQRPTVAAHAAQVHLPTVASPLTVVSPSPGTVRGGINVIRAKGPLTINPQQIKVVTSATASPQLIKAGMPGTVSVSTPGSPGNMSGIAALAAAAAATQKITTSSIAMPTTATTTTGGIKVVTPTIITPQGVKVASVTAPTTQTVRVAGPATTILKSASGLLSQAGKQIIVQKAGTSGTAQPQIVTLVKTAQGMTVATVPKVSLIQGKGGAGQLTTMQAQQIQNLQGKTIPQGATIVKLVTTQTGSGKPTTAIITTQAGGTQPTILGISSVSPQVLSDLRRIQEAKGGAPGTKFTTVYKTLPSGMVTMAKSGTAGVATTSSLPKQTIVIAAPKAGQPGTPAKILTTTMPKIGGVPTTQIIVVTTSGQLKTVSSGITSEAGKAKTGTTTVNVVPIPAGSTVNTVNTAGGVKMIVVSSGVQSSTGAITLITTAATSGVQTLTSSTASSPITFTLPASSSSFSTKPTTLTLGGKTMVGSPTTTATLINTGSGTAQLVAVPAQGILPTGTQSITIQGKPVTVTMAGAGHAAGKTVTLVSTQGSIMTSQASLINTVTTTQAGTSVSLVSSPAIQRMAMTSTSSLLNQPKVVVVSAPGTQLGSHPAVVVAPESSGLGTTTIEATPETLEALSAVGLTPADLLSQGDISGTHLSSSTGSLEHSKVDASSIITLSSEALGSQSISGVLQVDPASLVSGDFADSLSARSSNLVFTAQAGGLRLVDASGEGSGEVRGGNENEGLEVAEGNGENPANPVDHGGNPGNHGGNPSNHSGNSGNPANHGENSGNPGNHGGNPGNPINHGGNPGNSGDHGVNPGNHGGNPDNHGDNPGNHGGNPGNHGGNPGNHGGNPGNHGGNPGDNLGNPGGNPGNNSGVNPGSPVVNPRSPDGNPGNPRSPVNNPSSPAGNHGHQRGNPGNPGSPGGNADGNPGNPGENPGNPGENPGNNEGNNPGENPQPSGSGNPGNPGGSGNEDPDDNQPRNPGPEDAKISEEAKEEEEEEEEQAESELKLKPSQTTYSSLSLGNLPVPTSLPDTILADPADDNAETPMDVSEPEKLVEKRKDELPAAEAPPITPTDTTDGKDSLSTLASAAASTAASLLALPVVESRLSPVKPEVGGATTSANGMKNDAETKTEIKIDSPTKVGVKKENQWYDVGIIKGVSCLVSHFYLPSEVGERKDDDIDVVSVPDHSMLKKQELLPGTAYKFRVAGINACGRGPWSEVSAFKTCLPGYPGAPSAIKISKGSDGAHLSWEAPQNTCGKITEYSVYLAVHSATTQSQGDTKTVTSNPSQLAFVRVYCGPNPSCTVTNQSLSSAHIDYTTKPAIIFRIAARNEKGYGPATQVRWLQDGSNPVVNRPAAATATTSVKRPAAGEA